MSVMARERKINTRDETELFVKHNAVDSPKAAVVIVHGLCEHSGRYDYAAAKLNAFGYSVYRFDNRGHGRSGGEQGYLDDYQLYIEDTERIVETVSGENPGLPLFMLGHSMGGFIACAYGVQNPGRLAGQIFSGAAVIFLPIFAEYELFDFDSEAHTPISNELADIISRDTDIVQAYKDDPYVLKQFATKLMGEVFIKGAKWLMSSMDAYEYPCLILHGGSDQIVTPDASHYLYEHVSSKDKEIKIYEGLFHEILNEPEKDTVLDDINNWIEGRL